jgi:probable F420-dependent oxidoreductase
MTDHHEGASVMVSFGVHVAAFPDDPRKFGEMCKKIETSGFDSVWLADGLTRNVIDPMPGLAYASALTERLKVGTCIYVIPVRHPVVTAKLTASVDQLSIGRLILGVGVGWKEDEFQATALPFASRGAVMDECLQIIQQAWEQSEINFQGKFFNISGVRMQLTPVQKPRPPIWVGGNGRQAATRAARFGDCWIPTDYTVEEYEKNIGIYRSACNRFSRPRESVKIASHLMLIIDEGRDKAESAAKAVAESLHSTLEELKQWAIVGDPAEVVRRIEAYNSAGVNYHVFNFATRVRDDAGIGVFARDVLPSFS